MRIPKIPKMASNEISFEEGSATERVASEETVIGWFSLWIQPICRVWVGVNYRQVFLPIGVAWLCEMWYRILLIGCLHLSLRCATWFTI